MPKDLQTDRDLTERVRRGDEASWRTLYEVKLVPERMAGPIATVRFRYARPEYDGGGTPEVREIAKEFRFRELSPRFENTSPHFRLDAAVAEFAEILRGSYWAKGGRLSDVLPVARSAARDLREDEAEEFVSLVEQAARLRSAAEPEENREEP